MDHALSEGAASSAVPPPRRLPRGVIGSYGFGAVAYGVKDNGFGTFLLLFYNQVLGLPAAEVGLVIMAALVIDAFIDPGVGVLSDRTRSRWGRRHPWMYGALLPIMAGWILLWSPPQLPPGAALAWLFATAVFVRAAMSCYEVPSVALTPELSADYDERTRIMSWRYLFGWAGGLTMLVAAYVLFLAPTDEFPNGLLNREGYGTMAIAGAALMGVAILVSAVGTHQEIPRLPQVVPSPGGFAAAWRELLEGARNRAFAVLMLAGLAIFTNQGIVFALSNYLYSYVWEFEGAVFVTLALTLLGGAVTAFLIARPLGRRFGKPRGAAAMAIMAHLLFAAPYWLRLAGVFPEPGDPLMLPLLFGSIIASTACGITCFIMASSMMADVVEDSEMKTGRRSEGMFFAGWFFVQKCTSGVGIFLAGLILALAGFPDQARPGAVDPAILDRLTLIAVLIGAVIALGAALTFLRFPFGREEHEERVAQLASGLRSGAPNG